MQPKGLLKLLRLEGFVQNVTEYVENRVAIAKLEAKQKIADAGSAIIALVPAALFGLFALTFLSLTLAQALNVWLDSRVWGFLIVGAIYLIAAYVMFTMRNAEWLKKKIVDGSTKFLKDKPAQERAEDATAYPAAVVDHKKVIFEAPVREQESQFSTTADRAAVPIAEDRAPQPSTAARPSGNATIIVHSEEEEERPL